MYLDSDGDGNVVVMELSPGSLALRGEFYRTVSNRNPIPMATETARSFY